MNTAGGEQEDIPSVHPLWEERKTWMRILLQLLNCLPEKVRGHRQKKTPPTPTKLKLTERDTELCFLDLLRAVCW